MVTKENAKAEWRLKKVVWKWEEIGVDNGNLLIERRLMRRRESTRKVNG